MGVLSLAGLQVEIRVAGAIPAELVEELDGVSVITETVKTVLQGPLANRAALIGVISGLQGLGVELREIRRLAPRLSHPGRL